MADTVTTAVPEWTDRKRYAWLLGLGASLDVLHIGGGGFTFPRYIEALHPEAQQTVLELDPGEQEEALCGNRVDAVFFATGHPNGVTQGVTTGCRARLVRVAGPPVDALLATHPWYLATSIPGGMYPGNPQDVPTIATQAVCAECGEYGRFSVVAQNPGRDETEVCCRKCAHHWFINTQGS